MKSGTHSTARAWCAGILASVMLAGCGGSEIPMAEVEGEVKFDGKPIEWGTITFVPSDGKGSSACGICDWAAVPRERRQLTCSLVNRWSMRAS